MTNETTFEVSWAYGETSFINARDEAHAERVAAQMGRAHGLGTVLSVSSGDGDRCEDAPCCGCCDADTVGGMPYDGGGWAGDGSGMDDLADFNAMEGMDM